MSLDSIPALPLVQIANSLALLDRLRLAQTSRSIREELFAAHTLWNRVSVTHTSHQPALLWDRVKIILDLANSVPTHVRIENPVALDGDAHWNHLRDWLRSARTLDLSLSGATWFGPRRSEMDWAERGQRLDEVRQVQLDLFCALDAAPELEVLSVNAMPSQSSENLELPDTFLVNSSQSQPLRMCWLTGMSLANGVQYAAFRNVTSLVYSSGLDELDMNELATILDNMPLLEELAVDCHSFEGSHGRVLPAHDHLRRVLLNQMSDDGPAQLARLLPSVGDFYVHNNYTLPPSLYDAWPNGPIDFTMGINIIRVVGASEEVPGQIRRFTWVRDPVRQSRTFTDELFIPETHAHRLRSLTLHESQWPDAVHALPELFGLTDLTIVLSTCCERRTGFHLGMPSRDEALPLFGRGKPALWVPALQHLKLYAGERESDGSKGRCVVDWGTSGSPYRCGDGCVLAMDDLRDLLERLLDRTGSEHRMLVSLILGGVKVDGDQENESLKQFAQAIERLEAAPLAIVQQCKDRINKDHLFFTEVGRRLEETFEGMEVASDDPLRK